MKPFFVEHPRLRTDREARGTHGTIIERAADRWTIKQTLFDEEEANDWVIEASVTPPSIGIQLARIGP